MTIVKLTQNQRDEDVRETERKSSLEKKDRKVEGGWNKTLK